MRTIKWRFDRYSLFWILMFIVPLVYATICFSIGTPSMSEVVETYYDESIGSNVTSFSHPWVPAGTPYANMMGILAIIGFGILLAMSLGLVKLCIR